MLNISYTTPKRVSPARSQSIPPTESPSPSQRDSGVSLWWNAAKNRLTPTKEPLTTAQQVIQEAKGKEKHEKKEAKNVEKERKRSADWPAVPENKFNNSTLLGLVALLSPRQRACRSLLRYPRRLGLKAFDSVSHLAWYQALYVLIATMDRHLASHPVNPLRSICI